MKDGLAGAGAAVHADVEAGDGRVLGQEFFAQKKEQRLGIAVLLGRQGEPVGGVAEGDDEQMAIGNRKAVRYGEHAAVFGQNALPDLGIAKGACGFVVHGLTRNFMLCQAKSLRPDTLDALMPLISRLVHIPGDGIHGQNLRGSRMQKVLQ
jgi:hypothetical protein